MEDLLAIIETQQEQINQQQEALDELRDQVNRMLAGRADGTSSVSIQTAINASSISPPTRTQEPVAFDRPDTARPRAELNVGGNRFEFGGYAVTTYEDYEWETHADRRARTDIERIILEAEYQPFERFKLETELEFEHGGVGVTTEFDVFEEFGEFEQEVEQGGEIVIEKLQAEFLLDRGFNVKVGHIILPVGYLNKYHLPSDYFTPTREGARGYRLYFAPWPELKPVSVIDMQQELSAGGVFEELDLHLEGDTDFEDQFVTAPAPVNPGLGPVFSNVSCEACHPRNGRDAAPGHGESLDTMFLKLSMPGADPVTGEPLPVPGFGTQLFTKAVFGVQREGTVNISYTEETITLASGREVSLRTPRFDATTYMDLPSETFTSPRIGPPVFGRGLLEAIPEETILGLADEDDADGDGISGKPNYVWDPVIEQTVLGRFGLKANSPNLILLSADAYNQDMGVTNRIFPVESSHGQIQVDGISDDPELADGALEAVTFYVQTLSVPNRRNVSSREVEAGQLVFAQAGCASCHTSTMRTGPSDVSPVLANQVIHPYTDMLLHDMGPGLADGRPEFLADGNEWRTPPLWGIGMTRLANGHTNFLHDGRARNLLEAIMWHGGEAQAARDYVAELPEEELNALLAFLNSL